MTQQEVLNILKNQKKWLKSIEIAEKAGISKSSASCALAKMYKWKEVQRKPVNSINKWGFSPFPSGGYLWKVL